MSASRQMESDVELREGGDLPRDQVLALYRANAWSSADKPDALMRALAGSDAVVTAWRDGVLIGLANAISDGALVVYYPHMLVHPDHHERGVGRAILERLQSRYASLHQQVLVAEDDAVGFYERCGFDHPKAARAMWVYEDLEHA